MVIELDDLWISGVLVACKWLLSKLRLNGWFMQNPKCDQNELVDELSKWGTLWEHFEWLCEEKY